MACLGGIVQALIVVSEYLFERRQQIRLILRQRFRVTEGTNHHFFGSLQIQPKHCADGTNTSEGVVLPRGCEKDIFG